MTRNKELEALKGIKQAIAEHLHKQTGVSVEKHFEYLQYDTEISIVEQALTPPTADEVRKALSEQLKSTIVLRKNKHGVTFNYAGTGKTIVSLNYNLLNIKVQLPHHLITMIGKFYESLEGKK